MTYRQHPCVGARPCQFRKSLAGSVLQIVFVLALPGCGASPRQVVIEHSSPERLLVTFCQALAENDQQGLVEACDPPLRPLWKELLRWDAKHRRAFAHTPVESGLLRDMQSRFCGDEELLFDRPQPDIVLVRNTTQGGQIALRNRNGVWYVSFDVNPEHAEYGMRLGIEIIKSQLGQRPVEHKIMTESDVIEGG